MQMGASYLPVIDCGGHSTQPPLQLKKIVFFLFLFLRTKKPMVFFRRRSGRIVSFTNAFGRTPCADPNALVKLKIQSLRRLKKTSKLKNKENKGKQTMVFFRRHSHRIVSFTNAFGSAHGVLQNALVKLTIENLRRLKKTSKLRPL